ncbi:hypothetical protein [Halobacterium salinarum]|uniref:hypothetical protein n=1 Tax=Halobacterium salinarum TaxID=2242 RepID=UPI001F396313|nr:hypothetical protein [Halobacterium salinarum]MCF2165420.1 hypothetical protein [Halobacterium salinarum]MCF2168328.1 hypothetical protein [Halobacterium salinarum]
MSLPDPQTTEVEAITVSDDDVLPEISEDNPFREVIEKLREQGEDWQAIFEEMDAAYDEVEGAAYDESFVRMPDYEIEVVVHDAKSTSGERYKTLSRSAATEDEAREWAESDPEVLRVESIEKVGTSKVG